MKRAFILFFVTLTALSSAALVLFRPHAPLPRLGAIPAFAFTEASGRPLLHSDLDGRAAVVDFIFTSCPEVCPRMTAEMGRLQAFVVKERLDDKVRLLSVSVDPAHDTPEKLRDYARSHQARADLWWFATGPDKAIEEAVVNGFRIGLGRERDDQAPGGVALVHGTKFVLVDGARQIRGYYDANDAKAMAHLRDDLAALVHGRVR